MNLSIPSLGSLVLLALIALLPSLAHADCVPEEDASCAPTIEVIDTPPSGGSGGIGGVGGNYGCAGCTGGGNSGGGWTPTYSQSYTDSHSCNMSEQDRQQMAASAVRADVLQEQGERGQVGARRLEIRGYDGSRELFDVLPGNYGDFNLIYGFSFVSLVPGSCQSGTSGG